MTLILYFGHFGTTKKVAEILKGYLPDSVCIDGSNYKKINFNDYNQIIFGSNIRDSKLNKRFLKFYKKYEKFNYVAETYAYICSADENKANEYINLMKNTTGIKNVIFAGGELNLENARGLSKSVIRMCIEDFNRKGLVLPQIKDSNLKELSEIVKFNYKP